MTWGSTAPLAAATLTERWTAALAGVVVIRGPVVSTSTTLKGVNVAYQDANTTAYEGRFDPAGYAALPSQEQYTINCLITVRNGGKDAVGAETEAFTLLGLIGGDLAADQTLAGLALSARLGEWAMGTTQTNTGANARLVFGVDIDAFTIK